MSIDLDALRKKHQQLTAEGGANFMNTFYQIPDGTSYVRILPPKDEDGVFYAETSIHRLEIPGSDKKNVHCRKVHGEACPLCDAVYKLWDLSRANKEVGKGPNKGPYATMASKLRANLRYYMNVVDRETGEVKIFSVGKLLFTKIVNIMLDEDIGDITDLKTGRDFKIVKNSKGEWPDYSESHVRLKQEPAGSDKEIAEWMDSLHDIQKLVKLEDYDEVMQIAQQVAPSLASGVALSEDDTEDTSDEFQSRIQA